MPSHVYPEVSCPGDGVSSVDHSNCSEDFPVGFDFKSSWPLRRRLYADPNDLTDHGPAATPQHTKRRAKLPSQRLEMLSCSNNGDPPTCDAMLDEGVSYSATDFLTGFSFRSNRPVRRRLATHPSDPPHPDTTSSQQFSFLPWL